MSYDVIVKEVPSRHLAGVRGTYRMVELPGVMGREFHRIMNALRAEGIEPSGGALSIYHGWTEETVDVEMAVPIEGVFFPQNPRGDVKAGMIPGGKVLFTVHVGPYDRLSDAYGAMQQYAQTHNLELAGMMWEEYFTDPSSEPDLEKHVTEVYWPLV